MKKLVTLSAIALAGATMGVGTTFGWWDDPADVDADKVKSKVAEQAADKDPPGEENDVILPNVKGFDIKFVEPPLNVVDRILSVSPVEPAEPVGKGLNVPQPYYGFRVVEGGPADGTAPLKKLTEELDQEAKDLEAKGQKEAADVQRKLAQRLRDMLKSQPHGMISFGVGSAAQIPGVRLEAGKRVASRKIPVQEYKRVVVDGKTVNVPQVRYIDMLAPQEGEARTPLDDVSVAALKKQIAQLQEQLARLEKDVQKSQAPGKALELVAQAHKAEAAVEEAGQAHAQAVREREKALAAARKQLHAGHLDSAARELRILGEKLEKQGDKEHAKQLRTQADMLLQQTGQAHATVLLPDGGHVFLRDGSHPVKGEQHDVLVPKLKDGDQILTITFDDNGKPQDGLKILNRKKPDGTEERVIVRVEKHDDDKDNAGSKKGGKEEVRHEVKVAVPGGMHLGEMHKMLRELRHEIGELREEVRDLRGLLTSEQKPGKRVRVEEEEDDDDGDKDEKVEQRQPKILGLRKTKTKPAQKEEAKPESKEGSDDVKPTTNKLRIRLESEDEDDRKPGSVKLYKHKHDEDDAKSEDRKEDRGDKDDKDDKDDDESREDEVGKDEEARSTLKEGLFNLYLGLAK